MSKVSFRARQIDFNKPLPILTNGSDLLPEFSENALVNRGIPQIPSGMEKEEENEHHFVEVIRALQLSSCSDTKIPVPDIIDRSEHYNDLYLDGYSLPKQLLHIRSLVLADDETTEYDMDTDDEEWLNKSQLEITPLKFESMIDQLETGCGQKVMNLDEAKCLLKDDPSLVIAVYDYWLNKRVHYRQPLICYIRHERGDCGNDSEPYIAFRRRTEKMQTRKNRKNDEQSYEKMLLLREQMDSLGEILSRLVERESVKEDLIRCDLRCFETRYQLSDWDGTLICEAELSSHKSIASDAIMATLSPKESPRKHLPRKRRNSHKNHFHSDVHDITPDPLCPTDPFAFVRTQGCRYLKPREHFDRTSPCSPPHPPHMRYTLTTVPFLPMPNPPSYTGYVRRRLGRGGRVICDRLKPPSDVVDYFSKINHRAESITAGSRDYHAPSDPKESALRYRLLPITLSNHRRQPSFNWSTCTAHHSLPSFQPLASNPWHNPTSKSHSDHSKCSQANSSLHPSTVTKSDKQVDESPNLRSDKLRALVDMVFSAPTAIDPVDGRYVDGEVPMRLLDFPPSTKTSSNVPLSLEDKTSRLGSSPQFLGKLVKRRKLISAASLSDLGSTDVSRSAPNTVNSRFHSSTDDIPLLKENPSLPSSKVCCLPRERLPRDHAQLATTNGLNAAQFYQLPI